MVTTTLRAVILVAAVALGILVVRAGFPEGAPAGSADGTTTVPTTNAPTTTVTSAPSTTTPSPTPPPRIEGVVVQVLNGTNTDGLAAVVSDLFKDAGYTVRTPGNAADAPQTTIYYQPDYRVAARVMNRRFFDRQALVAPAPEGFNRQIHLTVVLGEDYVA